MTIVVTSAGDASWILSRCEARWFRGAGMLRYSAGPAQCAPARPFHLRCSSGPRETDSIIHTLEIPHVLHVLLVQGTAGKWHESRLCFPS